MSLFSKIDKLHAQAKANRWLWLFAIFNRLALAAGFFPAGIVKIIDERFASGLSANHPMGHYLEALHQTDYYYTFIGIVQIAAAIMLLIPQTTTLGAFLYFPIILNICVLTFATRFDGSMFTAPLMVMANLYLLAWDYQKWKFILPFNDSAVSNTVTKSKKLSNKFPTLFFFGVGVIVVFFVLVVPRLYQVKPRNNLAGCQRQFKDGKRTKAGEDFCNCIHQFGNPLNKCLSEYNNSPDDVSPNP
jgi:uncharacterized membrane protein YphA (DoxX/SURF4 family)